MANDYHNITLALAGVCQAATLVQQFAQNGNADEAAFKISISSLTQITPENILAVYGGEIANLRLGLEHLLQQLNGQGDSEISQYWLSLMVLANSLNKKNEAKTELAQRLQRIPSQLEYYDLLSQPMLDIFSAMYVDIVRPTGRPIMVKGVVEYLEQTDIQTRIRACLLAGIRSALLWRQVGGSKWQLLFSRRKILNTAQAIYNSL